MSLAKRKWRLLVTKSDKQLAREPQSNELLLHNSKTSLKRTKPETTPKPRKHVDSDLFDYWIDNLDSADQESFLSFAADNYSVIETYLFARFLGYKGSIADCNAWVNLNHPKPDHRKKLLYEINAMQEDISKLRMDIENKIVKRDAGVARIAQMQRELRGTIAQVEEFTSNKDRKGLLMAGADRAIRELMVIFKDDPIEIPLESATMSVWAKMQLEE